MPSEVNSLFLDLNSYFASCEQHLRPELRENPVAVVPMLSDSTCCIAASYEAKAFGIRTGTNVGEARRMCPDLILVDARPPEYIKLHHQVIAAVDTCVPVETIYSIDEMSCCLMGRERQLEVATDLAHRIKRAIATQVGETMRCSIGLAPNRFLAKLGTDMQKPDGLVVILREELPHRLHHLRLTDLPGIARKMEQHLNRQDVFTVEQLCSLGESDMVRVFHSITGRQWFHWLRGDDVRDRPTQRRSIGHQHVLSPARRTEEGARAVAMRLLHKAANRARMLGYWAERVTLSIRHVGRGSWSKWARLPTTQDTLEMVHAVGELWARRPKHTPLCVSVTLSDLTADRFASRPLFPQEQNRMKLNAAIDGLNLKYGKNLVYAGAMHDARESAPIRIAFSSVPDVEREW